MVHQIESTEDLNEQLKSAADMLVVIDFFATWCGPCKKIAPTVEALAKEYSNVVFLKVDVDESEDIAAEYNVTAMPTFIFWKSGAKVATFSGSDETAIRALVEQHK